MKASNLVEFTLVFADEAKPPEGESSVSLSRLSQDIERLRKLAQELERLNLNACNYGLSARQETRAENVRANLNEICAVHGIQAITQGDPRGAAFGIICPKTGRYNSWGGAESGFRLVFEGK